MCGWVNKVDEVDDFDWTRAQAETLSWGTGPVVDHSTGSSDGKSFCHVNTTTCFEIQAFK